MNINVKIIPHKEQRYDTCGDWWFNEDGSLEIRVSDLEDANKEFCIAIHEQIEAVLCIYRGITEKQVTDFDKENLDYEWELGDSSRAPYKREHCFATGIERLLVSELGIDWKTYEEIIDSL